MSAPTTYFFRDQDAEYERDAWLFIEFNEDLTPAECLVLLWLIENRRQPRYGRESVTNGADEWAISDYVQVTQAQIADALSLSPETVRSALNTLIAKHVIFKGNRRSMYCFRQPHTWGR